MEFKSSSPKLIESKTNSMVWFVPPTLQDLTLLSKEPIQDNAEKPQDADAKNQKWIEWCFEVWDKSYRDKDGNKFTNIKSSKDLLPIPVPELKSLLNEYVDILFGTDARKKSQNEPGTSHTTPR